MILRILLIIPTALLVWWFTHNLVRPDEYNWITWLMTSDASQSAKAFWGLIAFAGTVVTAGCLALFARRSSIAFCAVVGTAYVFANFIGAGFRALGAPMTPEVFATLALGMSASFPIVFSKMIAGKQIDIVGDEE